MDKSMLFTSLFCTVTPGLASGMCKVMWFARRCDQVMCDRLDEVCARDGSNCCKALRCTAKHNGNTNSYKLT